jgi:hypothetical protein
MVTLLSLWLPILLSAVLVFVASAVIHMFLGYHYSDYAPLPDEPAVASVLDGVPPGNYATPRAGSRKEMGSPEFQEKVERGPVALVSIRPPGAAMGSTLGAWFVYNVVVAIVAAYVASRAVGMGGDYGDAFRFAGTTAFAAYALGTWSESIWFGRNWSTSIKNTIDGIVYALLTGGVFGWLWPGT